MMTSSLRVPGTVMKRNCKYVGTVLKFAFVNALFSFATVVSKNRTLEKNRK